VTCPRCGAAPQTFCSTANSNSHVERWDALNDSRALGFTWTDETADDVLAEAHGGEWPPSPSFAPIRAEIEQILTDNPRTRYAKVLIGVRHRGLSNNAMAKEFLTKEGKEISPETIAECRRLLTLTLEDRLVRAPSDAAAQARIYRELLNYPHSSELAQHIMGKLADLRKLDPQTPSTPLR